jgi:hypothetical protein
MALLAWILRVVKHGEPEPVKVTRFDGQVGYAA